MTASLQEWSLGLSLPLPVQELAVKEAREQNGSCSNLVTHGEVSGSDFLSPDGNIWIKDLGGAPWL